jgi:Zn-dependent protease with chaperone function
MLDNWFKTTVLMAGIVVLFATVGMLLGGKSGMLIALAFAGAMNIYAYWFTDQAVLKMYNAQLVDASTAREFGTDASGASDIKRPGSTGNSITKIEAYAHGTPMETAERHPETAQMMIINPLTGAGIQGLFRTHPATEERVARLMAMRNNGLR